MESRSITALQDELDQKRMELLYVTEFELFLKDAKKINEAIKAREVFHNTKYDKEKINYLDVLQIIFDSQGKLNPHLSDGWTFDSVRASHATLKNKFLDNTNFSNADTVIIDSIDSLVVQILMEENASLKPKALAEDYDPFSKDAIRLMEDQEIESRRINDRTNLIINNARQSLNLSTVKEKIFTVEKNGEFKITINPDADNDTFSQHFLLAKQQYEIGIKHLVAEIAIAKDNDAEKAQQLRADLDEQFDPERLATTRYTMINKLRRNLTKIQQDSNISNKLDAMYDKIIECHMLANYFARSESLFGKASNLGNALEKFMIENCKMNKNEFNRRVKEKNIHELIKKYKKEDIPEENKMQINRKW